MDLNEIQTLIKFVTKTGADEVKLETQDFKITIKSGGKSSVKGKGEVVPQVVHTSVMPVQGQMPAPPQPQQQAPAQSADSVPAKPAQEESNNYIEVKSPMIGTFYRRPSPDKDVFVEVGDTIKTGDTVCIIEAMKLFNEIESEVAGKIVKVLVDDASPVEYDQPLFLVEPA